MRDPGIQVASWNVTFGNVIVPEGRIDFLFGDSCSYLDTAFFDPRGTGACVTGFAVPASASTRPMEVTLDVTMEVRRAVPVDLPDIGDYDRDGVRNNVDNCPLIPNPDQGDFDQDGIPDACGAFAGSGRFLLDSDGDLFADSFDNCMWVANANQADTSGSPPDGIGDACTEQVALVNDGQPIRLGFSVEPFAQAANSVNFLVIDFSGFDSLECDWNAGRCTLDPTAVKACTNSASEVGNLGCD